MTGFWAVVAAIGLAAPQASGPGVLRGVVRDAASQAPLSDALLLLDDTVSTALTDGDGSYRFAGVAPGRHRLRASRIGYAPLDVTVEVPADGTVLVDFLLVLRPLALPPVAARTTRPASRDGPPPARAAEPAGSAVVQVLESSPGVSELGLAATVRALLGPDPPTPDHVLFVRGAGAALDLVFLDGAPVHAPFHLGGLLEPAASPGIGAATRLQGGVSSRWDGGLSDVILLETRSGWDGPPTGSLYADMLSAGGLVEAGVPGRVSAMVAARATHGALVRPFLGGSLPQSYGDAVGRVAIAPSPEDSLLLTLFWNRETVRFGEESDGPSTLPVHEPEWGNRAFSLRYRAPLVMGDTELGIAWGEFRTRLPVGRTRPLLADAATRRGRLTVASGTSMGPIRLGYGLDGERLDLRSRFRGPRTEAGDSLDVRQRSAATAASAWLEAGLPLARRVTVSVGLRGSTYSDGLGGALSPRGRVDWSPGSRFVLSLSAGRFHQLIVTTDPDVASAAGLIEEAQAAALAATSGEVSVGASNHWVVGVRHAPRPGSTVELEGYWKTASGVPDLPRGTLRTAGLDLVLRQDLGDFAVWGSWSVAWAWARGESGRLVEVYDGRHFLRGGVSTNRRGDVRLDADLSYGANLEFGAIPRDERPPSGSPSVMPAARPGPAAMLSRIPGGQAPPPTPFVVPAPGDSYLRLNVQATATVRVRLFGRERVLLPYFRVINALDRRDALFYRYDEEGRQAARPVGSVPVMPVLGLEWRL